jgi:hypothetical protein
MNGKRIVVGGLLAGLVLNIGETILNVPVIGAEFDAATQRLGLPAMSGATVGVFVAMCFGLGIFATWLYAAIRPRFGAGAGTALIAGIAIWLLVSVWANLSAAAMGLFPTRLLAIVTVWQAIEIPLATLAGAWYYREAEPVRSAATQPV